MSKRLQWILAVMIAVAGACIPLLIIDIGFDNDDEFYQAYCTLDPDAMSPVAPLTFLLGKWWQAIFGNGIMPLRWLAWTFRVATALLAAGWYLKKSNKPIFAASLFTLIACEANYGSELFWDWNYPSQFFMVLLMIQLIRMYDTRSVYYSIGIGFIIGLMTMSRLPSVVFVVPAVVIACMAFRRAWWKGILLGLSAFAIAWVAVTLPAFGSFGEYFARWGERYFTSGHQSISKICDNIIYTVIPMSSPTMFVAIGCAVWAWVTHKLIPSRRAYLCVTVIGGLLAVWAFQRAMLHYSWIYGWTWVWLAVELVVMLRNYRELAPEERVVAWLAVAFTLLPMLGSNIPMRRWSLVVTVPFWLWACRDALKPWCKAFMAMLGTAVVLCTAVLPYRQITKCFVLKAQDATSSFTSPYLQGVKVWEGVADNVDTNLSTLARYASKPGGVLILGHDKFIYETMLMGVNTPDPWPHQFEYYVEGEQDDIRRRTREVLSRYDYVALVEMWDVFQGERQAFEPEILADGFRIAEETPSQCVVYARVNPQNQAL
ncbi:MAG: hypothetical protein LUC85_00995 [Bacteroidales bacterium]|nr:hypothetical protein [Bacteroidales bacterium]MCD8393394.1 hypothetical protein [Bacteroidales bacterium]